MNEIDNDRFSFNLNDASVIFPDGKKYEGRELKQALELEKQRRLTITEPLEIGAVVKLKNDDIYYKIKDKNIQGYEYVGYRADNPDMNYFFGQEDIEIIINYGVSNKKI